MGPSAYNKAALAMEFERNLAGTALSHVVHEGAKSRRLDVVFERQQGDSIKMQNEPTRSAGTGSFQELNLGKNPAVRKLLGVPPTRQSLHQVSLVEDGKKPSTGKARGKELYVTCDQLCFKNHQRATAESGYKSVHHHITARIQQSCPVSGHVPTRAASHLCPEVRDEEPDSFLDITTLSRNTGGSVCDSVIGNGMPLQAVIRQCIRLAGGRWTTTQAGEDWTRHHQMLSTEFWALMGMSPELFENSGTSPATVTGHLPTTEVKKLRYEACSCARRGEVSQVNPPCGTASSCMHSVHNYQSAIVGEFCRASPLLLTQQTAAGITDWRTASCCQLVARAHQHQMLLMQLLALQCVRSCELPKCTASAMPEVYDMLQVTRHANKAIEERDGSTTSEFRVSQEAVAKSRVGKGAGFCISGGVLKVGVGPMPAILHAVLTAGGNRNQFTEPKSSGVPFAHENLGPRQSA
ncbi:hypothetical protein GWK47_054245 [Chionoecetes opilio]|uniref:Uncharacterized protein n=1 Tax=Chionoecetes opilio TaxID=41210 RepID=A0A8J5CQ38_CHIOP|nr:hypothetical protein GWK47_054245 [Chionoecetes opilio]